MIGKGHVATRGCVDLAEKPENAELVSYHDILALLYG